MDRESWKQVKRNLEEALEYRSPGGAEAWRKEAESLPAFRVPGGYRPVDVEATLLSGWVTYGEFVADEKDEHRE